MSAAQKLFVWDQLDLQIGSSSIVSMVLVQKLRTEPVPNRTEPDWYCQMLDPNYKPSYIFALFHLLLIVHQANAMHWLQIGLENNKTLT